MTLPTNSRYIIGIDFGTTNCTIAYASIIQNAENKFLIHQLEIPQILAERLQGQSFSLPSFIHFPLEEEIKKKNISLPWNSDILYTVGAFAKNRGAELPARTIVSAKSWMCHTGINRKEALLPLETEDASIKMSPLQACTYLFDHLRQAWNFLHPLDLLEQQIVLVTVPASFDPSARQLIQEAAIQANYPEIILIEEPQAAFYAWLYTHAEDWRKQLTIGDTILVLDIGGGTTDFSLINVEEKNGDLSLNRLAVGSHLLLGGDNIDLSLAYLAKQKIEEQGNTIDNWQLQSLLYQCRQAKEKLLGENPPDSVEITILGRGSRLINNTFTILLTQEEVEKFIVNGFIPLIDTTDYATDYTSIKKRSGLQQVGLPYVQDPRISSQLAKFLSMTGESTVVSDQSFIMPTHILFNGGTMKAAILRQQILFLLDHWAKKLNKPAVKELNDPDYDFAVSRGAVYYGNARQGKAIRIKGGTNRSYYIGVEEAVPAVPGFSPPLQAVCIVPFGMEEGEEKELIDQEFALTVGEPAIFRFFSHSTPKLSDGQEPTVGTIIRQWKKELSELNEIEAKFDRSAEEEKTISVKLKAKVTELGVLELWCVAKSGRRWKLAFDTRV